MNNELSTDKVKRPKGVWILTIANGVFAGVLPIAGIAIAYYFPESRTALGLSGFQVFSTVALGALICQASYQTWKGSGQAKLVLLALITVHWTFIAYNNISFILSDSAAALDQTQRTRIYGNIVRAILWVGVNYWYFLGSRTKLFFRDNASRKSKSSEI